MLLSSTLFSLFATTSALTLATATENKRDANNNFYAGNCVFYWVPDLLQNTPMNIEIYDAMATLLFTDTTTPLPSWANNEAYVLIYELDRWIGIQSQPANLPAMFAYGSHTRISLDPQHLSAINITLGSNGDMPNPGECAWPLPNDSLKPNSQDLMKCAFSCGPGY
ncbi:MAG: hypothetical protein Q9161_007936 [Pseudevernia consocians]